MKYLILALILVAGLFQQAHAERINSPITLKANYDLTTDFIESDRKCKTAPNMCSHTLELCVFMTPNRVRELHYFIRNEYPFKAKNGGMNIAARFSRALRHCQ